MFQGIKPNFTHVHNQTLKQDGFDAQFIKFVKHLPQKIKINVETRSESWQERKEIPFGSFPERKGKGEEIGEEENKGMDYKGVRKVEVEEKGKNGGGEERGKGEEEGKKDKNYDFQHSNDNLDKKSKLQREEDGIKNTEDEGSISN